MYHSITLGNKNTWNHWHLIPDSRPLVNTPKPKTEYVDIPGADGSLDYTEALGNVKYQNREGSWTFYVMNDYGEENYDYKYWWELYNSIVDSVHGKHMLVHLEDDPNYVYIGRVAVDEWSSEKDYSKITFSYVFEPYKKRGGVNDSGEVYLDDIISTATSDWLWDELYDNTFIYGQFDVIERKARTIINRENKAELEFYVTCTSDMEIHDYREVIKIKSGQKTRVVIPNRRDAELVFVGTGHVTIDYDKDGVVI